MKRWDANRKAMVERLDTDRFLAETAEVGRPNGLSISHEDREGPFEVVPFDGSVQEWLLDAQIRI